MLEVMNADLVLAGSALIEAVFAWPGIGRLLFESISKRDYPVMLAILLMVSATVVGVASATFAVAISVVIGALHRDLNRVDEPTKLLARGPLTNIATLLDEQAPREIGTDRAGNTRSA